MNDERQTNSGSSIGGAHSAIVREPPGKDPHQLACMEVWGGNGWFDSAIALPGIDAYVYARPYQAAAAGGDVLYVSSCGTGRIGRLLVADVAGHGAPVADLARTLRDLMRRYINHIDQSALMASMNQAFGAISTAGRFATAVAATYWAETDCLTMTNAGHPRPMWYRAGPATWTVLQDHISSHGTAADNLPFGIVDMAQYDHITIRLMPGDIVLFYSDSITESRDATGQMLGECGLQTLLGGLDASKPQELVARVVAHLKHRVGGGEPDDDMTILAMVCTGKKQSRSLREKWRSMVLIGRAIIARSLGRDVVVPWPEMSMVNILGPFIKSINRRWGGGLKPGEIRTGTAFTTNSRKERDGRP